MGKAQFKELTPETLQPIAAISLCPLRVTLVEIPKYQSYSRNASKPPIAVGRRSSEVRKRFVMHDSRAENSIRFVGTVCSGPTAAQTDRKAADQSNVF